MKRADASLHSISAKQWLVCGVRDLLFLVGVVALTYVACTLWDARIQQVTANETLTAEIRATANVYVTPAQVAIQRGDVVGRIDIPRLGLSVAILQGTSSRTLRLGAGHMEGTPLPGEPGNSAVAGHRDTFFRSLKDIRKDDEIEIQMATGVLHYEVDWVRVVAPDDTSVLQPSGETSTLTLVTCYPFYLVGPAPKRFVVHARKS
jgi:sortase A